MFLFNDHLVTIVTYLSTPYVMKVKFRGIVKLNTICRGVGRYVTLVIGLKGTFCSTIDKLPFCDQAHRFVQREGVTWNLTQNKWTKQ